MVLSNSHPPIDSDLLANQDLTRVIVELGKVRLLQIATASSFKLFYIVLVILSGNENLDLNHELLGLGLL